MTGEVTAWHKWLFISILPHTKNGTQYLFELNKDDAVPLQSTKNWTK